MKDYEKPMIEVVNFAAEIITDSQTGTEGGFTSDNLSGEGGWT